MPDGFDDRGRVGDKISAARTYLWLCQPQCRRELSDFDIEAQ
jgi:hypothetical protein